jgi:hypothetical protein
VDQLIQNTLGSTVNGPALFRRDLTFSGCGVVPTTLVELLAVDAFFAVKKPFVIFRIVASARDEVVETLIEEVVVEHLTYGEQFGFIAVGHHWTPCF